MRIDNDPKLDFDDVLIRPKRSEAPSRSAIVLEREHRFLNSGANVEGSPDRRLEHGHRRDDGDGPGAGPGDDDLPA